MTDHPDILSRSPADGRPLGRFQVASGDDLRRAVASARAAAASWAREEALRVEIIRRMADTLRRHEPELAERIADETGKPLWEARGEVAAMISKCELSIRSQGERRRPVNTAAGAVSYRPHGVVAVLGPFNFPGHLPWGHLAPALLAGNAVIFKPSEKTPAVGQLLGDLLLGSGLPPGVLQVVHGAGDTAAALVDQDIDAVLFTGSYRTGTSILRRLVDRPGVLAALELGGNNPIVAWSVPEDLVHAAAVCIVLSAFMTAGQRCSCARRLIVPRGHRLTEEVVRLAARLRIGLPHDQPPAFYGPLIDEASVDRVLRVQRELVAAGGTVLLAAAPRPNHRLLVSPGIVRMPTPARLDVLPPETLDDEVFGPLLQVTEADTFDEAIGLANHTRYGLAAGLLSPDASAWADFRVKVRAGVLTWNRPTTGASSELPFGGIRRSGNHRPSAYFAADYCSYAVAEMGVASLEVPSSLPPGLLPG